MPENDCLEQLKSLVSNYTANIDEYKKGKYDESNTRTDFIDKFFTLLDWDVANNQAFSELYREVVREDKVKIEGNQKAPDYSFRIGGVRKFFVEAKKPSVNIKEAAEPAFQVRRYAYTAKLPLSILTNFEEFAIYDTRIKPDKNDKASVARIDYFTFKEYEQKFDFLYNTFSKNAINKGSFDKYVIDNKNKKGTSEVDTELLALVEEWRIVLAKNIAKNNPNLSVYNLNTVVQKIIDRIIFLRIAEDRGIEDENILMTVAKTSNVYEKLNLLFTKANVKYNSGLFAYIDWIEKVIIKDEVLSDIIVNLYYPECPYEFSVLPIEILGSIYERFLGNTIHFRTIKGDTHTAIVEEKPEVKKAGGVYYTPQYIVDYIVLNTVGEKIKNKKPEEIAAIKICDPACGSGSFLVGAYQYLLNYHLDYYTKEKNINTSLKNKRIFEAGHNTYKLTIEEKKRILCSSIFGVDIDNQAVEVTKLSLYLKLLENESRESSEQLFKYSDIALLPSLEDNIKCGNSLIGKDFYNQGQLDLSDDERIKVNCFDWDRKDGFEDIFKNGGFDVVIGNPPYGAELMKTERNYLEHKFNVGNTDTAALFMLHARKLSKVNGKNGFIIPKAFTYASNWQTVRDILLPDIEKIADCGKVWQNVKLEMSIYINQLNNTKDYFDYYKRNDTVIEKFGTKKRNLCQEFNLILNGVSDKETEIGLKIKRNNKTLNDYVENNRGGMFQANVSTTGNIKVLGGKQIERYNSMFTIKGKINKDLLVNEPKSFILNNSLLVQNIVAHIENPKPHITIIATLPPDPVKQYAILDTVNQLKNNSELSKEFILGVVNSKLVSWYAYRFIFANAIRTMHFDSTTTAKIPFPTLDLSKKTDKTKHDALISFVAQILDLKKKEATEPNQQLKTMISRQIDSVDKQIDTAVYQLYNLTDDEIKVVEE
jgi:adenine-specific DNA-methyltransferase